MWYHMVCKVCAHLLFDSLSSRARGARNCLGVDLFCVAFPLVVQAETMREEDQIAPKDTENDSCLICYDTFFDGATPRGGDPRKVDGCRHVFCQTCLREHTKHAIFAKQLPIPCPCRNDPELSCTVELTKADVAYLLALENDVSSRRAWRLFERLEQLRANPSLLICPWCDAFADSEKSDEENQLQSSLELQQRSVNLEAVACQACGKTFCAVHGSAHPGQTCAEYLSRQKRKANKASERAIRRSTKACSHCKERIQKTSGCDHIICPACGNDWCFRCGTHVYLSGKVIRSCSKCRQGFLDHRHECTYRLRLLLCLPLLVPSFIIYAAVVIFLAVISFAFCCCFGCGRCLNDPANPQVNQSHWWRGTSLGLSILIMPLTIVLRDFGFQCGRLPNEIYNGLQQGEQPGTSLPGFDTMETTNDADSPTQSATEFGSV